MMMNNTLAQLRDLKLAGAALALEEQLVAPGMAALSFEERLALLVDREVHHRDDRRRTLLLKKARLKHAQACVEDLDTRPGRGIERSRFMSLALSRWVEDGATVVISGATGTGKSWMACALAQYACRRGHSALYLRVPRLGEELRILHGNGGFTRWLHALARTDVVILDDWGLAALDATTRADLLEVVDDRAGRRATVIAGQLPVEHWHAWIGDATIADAMLDRLLANCHRIALEGPSLRPPRATKGDSTTADMQGAQRVPVHSDEPLE